MLFQETIIENPDEYVNEELLDIILIPPPIKRQNAKKNLLSEQEVMLNEVIYKNYNDTTFNLKKNKSENDLTHNYIKEVYISKSVSY
jgi:hypothetical protein